MPYQDRHVETLSALAYSDDDSAQRGATGSAEQRLIRSMLLFTALALSAAVLVAVI